MHLNRYACSALLVCALLATGAPAFAQDHGHGQPQMDEKAMMEAYMKASAPGEHHANLKAFTGTWTTKSKAWMAPDKPPMESTGMATTTEVLGGRFVREEYEGNFMNMPFKGMGLTGYDNAKKKYTSMWVDNMSSHILTLEGDYDAAKKIYTFDTEYVDPLMGQTKMRLMIRMIDDNHHVTEFYSPTPDGKWAKAMEIAYTRK